MRKITRTLFMNFYLLFENALQEDGDDINDEVANFLIEDLGRCYPTILKDLREEIDHNSVPKKKFSSKNILFSEKIIVFLYSIMIKFCETSKVKGIPVSQIP